MLLVYPDRSVDLLRVPRMWALPAISRYVDVLRHFHGGFPALADWLLDPPVTAVERVRLQGSLREWQITPQYAVTVCRNLLSQLCLFLETEDSRNPDPNQLMADPEQLDRLLFSDPCELLAWIEAESRIEGSASQSVSVPRASALTWRCLLQISSGSVEGAERLSRLLTKGELNNLITVINEANTDPAIERMKQLTRLQEEGKDPEEEKRLAVFKAIAERN